MIVRRLGSMVALFVITLACSSCAQLGQATSFDPKATGHVYAYTAIGASDAVGFGSSAPCPTSSVVIGPDTEQMPNPVNCPGGAGYVPVASQLLAVAPNSVVLTDLGISGAVAGATERTLGNTWEPFLFGCSSSGPNVCIPGDFIDDELPIIPANQEVVTVFAGGNDTNAILAHVAIACASCTPDQVKTMVMDDIMSFGADFQTLLLSIHAARPLAHIYAANLPNFALIPRGICIGSDPSDPPPFCGPNDPAEGQPALQALLDVISTNIDSAVINTAPALGIPVIDLECNPASYDPANFYIDGFHPDDAGYRIFAKSLAKAIRVGGAPAPQGNCQFSQARIHASPSVRRRVKLPFVRY